MYIVPNVKNMMK